MDTSTSRSVNVCTAFPKPENSPKYASSITLHNTDSHNALTPCLFRHATRNITFCLVVDDLGVRYGSKEDADFLINVLQLHGYELTIKWDGETYLGMTVTFNRLQQHTVSLAMPNYITEMLAHFRQHYSKPSHRVAKTSGIYIPPNYGQKEPQLSPVDSSAPLSAAQKLEIQGIVGTALYYARAVDPTLLPVANELASQQANPTLKVLQASNRFLSYCTAHRDNQITYLSLYRSHRSRLPPRTYHHHGSWPTTPPPSELQLTPLSRNVQKPSTCVSTESATVPNKGNSPSPLPLHIYYILHTSTPTTI
jgi:hypothetical protein